MSTITLPYAPNGNSGITITLTDGYLSFPDTNATRTILDSLHDRLEIFNAIHAGVPLPTDAMLSRLPPKQYQGTADLIIGLRHAPSGGTGLRVERVGGNITVSRSQPALSITFADTLARWAVLLGISRNGLPISSADFA